MADIQLTVSAAEANRSFSKLLRAAKAGTRVTITSHGEPVAELGPVGQSVKDAAERERRKAMLDWLNEHWKTLSPVDVGPWRREDLYERD